MVLNEDLEHMKLCPRCGERPRAVSASGNLLGYCTPCSREYQNNRNRARAIALKFHKNPKSVTKAEMEFARDILTPRAHLRGRTRGDNICPRCNERERAENSGYCAPCNVEYRRARTAALKEAEMAFHMETIALEEQLPSTPPYATYEDLYDAEVESEGTVDPEHVAEERAEIEKFMSQGLRPKVAEVEQEQAQKQGLADTNPLNERPPGVSEEDWEAFLAYGEE